MLITKKYINDLAKARRAVAKGKAYHWQTIADILMAEVEMLEVASDSKEASNPYADPAQP